MIYFEVIMPRNCRCSARRRALRAGVVYKTDHDLNGYYIAESKIKVLSQVEALAKLGKRISRVPEVK